MAVCLLLAVKFNESLERKKYFFCIYFISSNQFYLQLLLSFFRIDGVLDFCDQQLLLPKKDIFEAEFGAFVHLNFSLHYPLDHVYLMYSRLLKQV